MLIEQLTLPATTALVSKAKAESLLGLEADADPNLEDLILEASQEMFEWSGAFFVRQRLRESAKGYGRTNLTLGPRPVASVESIVHDGHTFPATDYQVDGQIVRHLHRAWPDTAHYGHAFPGTTDVRLPNSEAGEIKVTMVVGFLLDSDDITDRTDISFDSDDNSINTSGPAFPLLVPGDQIDISGAGAGPNTGKALVVSRTDTKIVVSIMTVADQGAGNVVSIKVRNLPRSLERACVMAVRHWRTDLDSEVDDTVKTLRVEETSMTFDHNSGKGGVRHLPAQSQSLIRAAGFAPEAIAA